MDTNRSTGDEEEDDTGAETSADIVIEKSKLITS
jgi:hypothetical protein